MSALHQLRKDIKISTMGPDRSGFPRWCLYCPVTNRYFMIGWSEYEILTRWHFNDPLMIAKAVSATTTLEVESKDVTKINDFIFYNELFEPHSEEEVELIQQHRQQQKSQYAQPRQYLSLIFPLIHPNAFLQKSLWLVKPLASHAAFLLYFLLGLVGMYWVNLEWNVFVSHFNDLLKIQNLFFFLIAIFVVKLVHEFAHAYAARYYDCDVSAIGVAIIFFRPVLYTDVTDAWRIASKRKRLIIEASGMVAEIAIAFVSLFLWALAPTGDLKIILFFIATFSWVSSIFINLNPFFCFDGYFLLADYLEVENMQKVAFDLGRWRLRESLFGFKEPAPYFFPKRLQRTLIIYAYLAWLYRGIIFFALSLLVYYLFFKTLGLLLLSVQLFYFLLLPVLGECKQIWIRRHRMQWNRQSFRTLAVTGFFLIVLLYPWQQRISAPGFIDFRTHQQVLNHYPGTIVAITVAQDQTVQAQEKLLQLHNPDLAYQIEQLTLKERLIRLRYAIDSRFSQQLGYKVTSEEELYDIQKQLQYLKTEQEKLSIRAPVAGTVHLNLPTIKAPHWISSETPIAEIIDKHRFQITAYVDESVYKRLELGMKAVMFLNDGQKINAKLVNIDAMAKERLSFPYLADIFGGSIRVIPGEQEQLYLKEALFRVELEPTEAMQLQYPTIGEVVIYAQRKSLALRFWRWLSSMFIRNSGF
jgi:putative peptide zinc metalloprotease protein